VHRVKRSYQSAVNEIRYTYIHW